MEPIRSIHRLVFVPILLATFSLSPSPVGAFRGQYRLPLSRQYSLSAPPTALDSDSDLLHALEFLEQYERAKSRETSGRLRALPDLEEPDDFSPFPRHGNEIPPLVFGDDIQSYRKWDDDEDDILDEVDLEDLYEPRPEDLETNEVAFAEAILNEYKEYESKRQRELFDKILGDVMAEKLLEQDEEENIARLMEEQDEEQQGLDDLAAILDTSSSAGSEPDADVYEPQDLELPMFSASSTSSAAEVIDGGESQSSAIEIEADDFFVSEAGLDLLDEAERILKEGHDNGEEAESSESLPDFDDTSDLTSLFQDDEESPFSEIGDITIEEKEESLKDIIYRIVQDTLRKKLVESVMGPDDTDDDVSMESSMTEGGDSDSEEREDERYTNLLDNLVDEIRDQVDQLSSKIIKEIEDEDIDEVEDDETTYSDENDDDDEDNNESDGYFNETPILGESSSIPDEVIDEIIGGGGSSFLDQDVETPSSSIDEEIENETMLGDEELMNAIKEIIPAAETKVCPILEYIVDDCSVIDGFRGLGADGYRQAFSRPCNRHQICYTCSASYEIPTQLCDEIYKAELLTLCNGDPECLQRAKYFWLAATSDRTAPDVPLSLCSDRCVLDFLLRD